MLACQTKRFFTRAMIPEVEVVIVNKMAESTYSIDPYQFVSKVLKGGGGTYVYCEVEMNY